ncbi:MAG: hypothetical protein ACFFEE_04965, partial [Candidatus Thorarchaeota archaeon]
TISPVKMATDWWSVRWVRGLVIMLIPVGVVDSVYTISMALEFGPEIEFNPITRWFLANSLWPLWAIINIMGYTFFCMLAGSYYLHTRNHPSGPDTFWLSLIISLRIGMTAYNVTFFYIPIVVTVYPPFWVGFFSFCGSLYLTNNLFRRRQDLSWREATSFATSRLDNWYDAKLIRDAKIESIQNEDLSSERPKPMSDSDTSSFLEPRPEKRRIWIKRFAYFAGLPLSIFGMVVTLNIVAVLSNFESWQNEYSVLNSLTGPIFMASFIVILFFVGLSMYFVFKAFTIIQEDEFPV